MYCTPITTRKCNTRFTTTEIYQLMHTYHLKKNGKHVFISGNIAHLNNIMLNWHNKKYNNDIIVSRENA